MRFFDLSHPVWQAIGKAGSIMLLSVLWIVCSLPVITIGAASIALNRKVLDVLNASDNNLVKGYFSSFAAVFRRVTLLWVGCIAIGTLFIVEMLFFGQLEGNVNTLAKAAVLVLGIVWVAFVKSMFLIGAVENISGRKLLSRSAANTLRVLPIFTLLAALETSGTIFACYEAVWLLPFLPGICAFLDCKLFRKLLIKEGGAA